MKLPSATIHDMPQGSPEWHAIRAGKATASRFSKILTPGGKLSAQALPLARVLARECFLADPQEWKGNKYTEWGNEHEGEARWQFEERTGLTVSTVGFATNDANPVIGCSPDGLIHDLMAGVEIKCPQIDTLMGWHLDIKGAVPPEYLPQVHGSMIVTGLREWEFCGHHPGAPLYLATARWDGYTDRLAAALDEFTKLYKAEYSAIAALFGKGEG